MRLVLDRVLSLLTGLALRGFFRSVEVEGRDRIPADRPLLIVANHFNGLVDAALIAHTLGRIPRFVAKAELWERRLARPFLWLAGLVPVHRRGDRGDPSQNVRTFATCHELLVRGKVVAVFPEGAVSATPSLLPVRTGAARIALGARDDGARGLVIVPLGLAYEDRLALRSRALVRVGRPIDVDADLASSGTPKPDADGVDHAAVRTLTADIATRLGEVVPAYSDYREAAVLGRAAELALRPHGRIPPPRVPLLHRETVAQELARTPRDARTRLLDALARYELDLALLGLRDAYLVAEYRAGRLLRLALRTAFKLALTAPLAVPGLLINVLPYWAVRWTGRLVRDPLMRATGRLLAGALFFPVAWIVVAVLSPVEGWLAHLAVIATAPLLGLITVWSAEQAVSAARSWRGWITLMERAGDLGQLRDDRARVVTLVTSDAPSARAFAAPDA